MGLPDIPGGRGLSRLLCHVSYRLRLYGVKCIVLNKILPANRMRERQAGGGSRKRSDKIRASMGY